MVSESKRKAIAKYNKEKTKMKGVRFCPKDMDLLEYAEAKGSFSGYVIGLIRSDMERNQ